MFFKSVFLNIFCNETPCKVTILTYNDKIIKEQTLQTNQSKIFVCTNSCFLQIYAEYNDQIIYQTIYLSLWQCQNYYFNFLFEKKLTPTTKVNIVLTDKKYGTPVLQSILQFNSVSS